MKRSALLGIVALGVTGAILLALKLRGGSSEEMKFRKEKVDRGDIVQAVTASGTLSAVTTVQVGSQVSGIVSALHADFNSVVRKGQLLAELDAQPFQATVDQRRADIARSHAELRDADREFARSKRLADEGILSQGELDAATARQESAVAVVNQGEASLRQALVNLGNTRIASPIDGVVVARQYDIGQTVAASFQAPTLFTIAQDLTRMQVLTNIDEADIGGVAQEQAATFTVDAFPGETFEGRVSQVRLSAQTVQNVVTYPVVIDVANPEGRLKPGMTADVTIPVRTAKDVLRVPNSALRFRPDPSMLAKAAPPAAGTGAGPPAARGGNGAPPSAGREGVARGAGGARSGGGAGAATVHVQDATGQLRPVAIRTGITDGARTAVEGDALKEGDEIVVGLATTRAQAQPTGRSPAGGAGGGMRGPRM